MNDLIPGARVEGCVQLDGEDVYSDSTDVSYLRRRVGMIFQRSNLFPMSVFDNIAYGVRVNGITRNKLKLNEIVERALRSAALWDEIKDRLNKSAMSLCGGEKQRLCIARALAVEPEVLLMDEPASALDPMSAAKIEELICELRRSYTIAIVTHNIQQAARFSDETGFFLNGRLVEFSETKKLFNAPANRETEDYITGRFG
jgi:phosphate transport system ATP-binding protein